MSLIGQATCNMVVKPSYSELEKQLAAAKEEIERLRKECRNANKGAESNAWINRSYVRRCCDALKTKLADAEKWIVEHGQHPLTCGVFSPPEQKWHYLKCTCGLDALKSSLSLKQTLGRKDCHSSNQ